MAFVLVGVLFIVLHLAGIGPMANWNWNAFGDLWKFVVPFLFAGAWWWWSDASGLDKRREIERMEQKKRDRRTANLAALGMDERARQKRSKAKA